MSMDAKYSRWKPEMLRAEDYKLQARLLTYFTNLPIGQALVLLK
jgi:hypothetical protein